MSNKKQNILVAGANGTTGRIIIDLLKDSENYTPIAMVRKEEQKERFENQNVKTVLADLEEDLNPAMQDVDKVIFAAGSKGKNVIAVDQEGAKRFTQAAEENKAKKLVMLSSMGADNPSVMPELEDYLKAKQNADKHLKSSSLNYTIVRPGGLTDKEGTGKIELQEKMKSPGYIPRADVAKTLVEVLEDEVKNKQTFEIISGDTAIEKAVR